jgi:hypothetical protein
VGPGADQFTVRRDTGGAYRIFTVSSGSVVSISGITISNGLAFNGGGIYNSGRLVLTDSTVRGNAADGQFAGGIHNDGALILRDSTVSDNVAAEFGGGINNFGKAKLIRSTVDSNTVDSATDEFRAGGGINSGGISNTLRVVNSTISGNTITSEMSLGRGGGISNSGSLVWLKNVTLKGNQGTLGANLGSSGPTRVKNTVVANPTGGGDNCAEDAGIIISKGYNLDSGTSCGFTAIGDIQNQNPLLGRLANNGGPTKTHALLEGSPAIDQGNPFRTNTDQRGESRPHDFADIDNAPGGDGSDIGAFEVQPTAN